MLKFAISIPAGSAPDVVKGRLSVSIAGGEPIVLETAVGPTDVSDERFQGNDNDSVHAELVYTDDAGNDSTPSVLDTVLTDTIAPPAPGELGLRVTAEE